MRRLWVGLPAAVMPIAALAAAATVAARPGTFGVAQTKACLMRRGASFQAPGTANGLTAAQQSETLVGTLPAGGAPAFLYLAIGRDAADAIAIRSRLLKQIVPVPSAANSRSASEANAAWVIVSLAGARPPAALESLVASCLVTGAAPTGVAPSPARYVPATISLCLQANGRATAIPASDLRSTRVSGALFGRSVPAAILPRLLVVYTSTTPATTDGIGLLILFGRSRADALRLRSRLLSSLHLAAHAGTWLGAKRNVAWYGFHSRHTTAAGAAEGRQTLLSCLMNP